MFRSHVEHKQCLFSAFSLKRYLHDRLKKKAVFKLGFKIPNKALHLEQHHIEKNDDTAGTRQKL